MWPGLVLPHSEQVWNLGARQRLAPRRMRLRHLVVLVFGAAMVLDG